MLGQAHPPWRRLLGIVFAASFVLVLPAVGGAEPPPSTPSSASLKAESTALASKERSAVLSLYALDSSLARARTRLEQLERQAARLRQEQITLAFEMKVAISGARVSEQRLASQIRLLFHHGTTTSLEIILGATSLEDALTGLDNLDRVTSANRNVVDQLRAAKVRVNTTSRALNVRAARLAAATRAQAATTRALAAARVERAAYLDDLRRRRELNSVQIQQLQSQAHAAGVLTAKLTAGAPTAASAPPVAIGHGRTLTVSAVAYSLPGYTASGLPVGWGVVAVDPSVIPLGTHMTIPGYGEAVAADTGSAIKGAMIDLWFPSYAMAAAWGRRSVTITLD